jgi:integrase
MLSVDKLVDNRLSLRTQKSSKDISVLLPPPVIEAMNTFKPVTKTHFFWDGLVTLKSLTNLYRDFYLAPVFKAAKLTGNPHPHQFRHTFASKLLSSGTSVENVAVLLGNTPKIVWKHYAAWVKERYVKDLSGPYSILMAEHAVRCELFSIKFPANREKYREIGALVDGRRGDVPIFMGVSKK